MLRSAIQPPLTAAKAPNVTEATDKPSVLAALSIRSFRYLWLSNGLTFVGVRIPNMAIAWLVLELTDSRLWVGIANGLPAISVIFFSLLGGVLTDRTDRRALLLWSRLTSASLIFLAAFLITSEATSEAKGGFKTRPCRSGVAPCASQNTRRPRTRSTR